MAIDWSDDLLDSDLPSDEEMLAMLENERSIVLGGIDESVETRELAESISPEEESLLLQPHTQHREARRGDRSDQPRPNTASETLVEDDFLDDWVEDEEFEEVSERAAAVTLVDSQAQAEPGGGPNLPVQVRDRSQPPAKKRSRRALVKGVTNASSRISELQPSDHPGDSVSLSEQRLDSHGTLHQTPSKNSKKVERSHAPDAMGYLFWFSVTNTEWFDRSIFEFIEQRYPKQRTVMAAAPTLPQLIKLREQHPEATDGARALTAFRYSLREWLEGAGCMYAGKSMYFARDDANLWDCLDHLSEALPLNSPSGMFEWHRVPLYPDAETRNLVLELHRDRMVAKFEEIRPLMLNNISNSSLYKIQAAFSEIRDLMDLAVEFGDPTPEMEKVFTRMRMYLKEVM